jgi:glycosyltransferase involved in cell wall biosynthesis
MNPLLSILIPTIPERSVELTQLLEVITPQTKGMPCEVLCLLDNRQRSIGLKRNALLDIAIGKYVAFCDDDDMVSEDYVATLCDMAKVDVDVLCFKQMSRWNDLESTIEFRIHYPVNGIFRTGGITKRFPWHVCAWRRSLAQQCIFTDKNFGEDLDWAMQANELAHTEAYSPKVLHFYTHRDHSSTSINVDKILTA